MATATVAEAAATEVGASLEATERPGSPGRFSFMGLSEGQATLPPRTPR